MAFYFLLFANAAETPKKLEAQRVLSTTTRSSQRRNLNRARNARQLQRVKKASRIVCVYWMYGRVSTVPTRLEQQVWNQARKISAMSVANRTRYCLPYRIAGLTMTTRQTTRRTSTRNPLLTTPRPFPLNTPIYTTPTSTTTTTMPFFSTSSSTITPVSSTSTPSTTSFRSIIMPIASVLPVFTLPTTTISSTTTTTNSPILTTTTTTTKKPADDYYYSGSGSASYSGSGSAYYSATGSLTASSDKQQSSRLMRPSNDVAMRTFKAKNGDIIVKWTPGGGNKLKKI